jgi:hypothetical protein
MAVNLANSAKKVRVAKGVAIIKPPKKAFEYV